jgi:hypothetical protein
MIYLIVRFILGCTFGLVALIIPMIINQDFFRVIVFLICILAMIFILPWPPSDPYDGWNGV